MVLLWVPLAIGGAAAKEGLVFCMTTISRTRLGLARVQVEVLSCSDVAEFIVHRLDIT